MQAIILVGGFGTRLQAVVPDLPKPMAPIQGKPFLHHLLHYLVRQGITSALLALHYKAQVIQAYFGEYYAGIRLSYVLEPQALGTGGAIQHALSFIADREAPVFVLNGDTLIKLNYANMLAQHHANGADLTMALCKVENCARYGTIVLDKDNKITGFKEKNAQDSGFINSGVYLLNKNIFAARHLPSVFSFEQDFLMTNIASLKAQGFISNDYFIDIGIPEDYARAQREFINN